MGTRLALKAVQPLVVWLGLTGLGAGQPSPADSLLRAVDLNVGESQDVRLSSGLTVTVRLLDLEETTDDVNGAVRRARVTVEVDGRRVELTSATYHLPVTSGDVQLDCPITSGYLKKADSNMWALDKDARIRLWPRNSSISICRGMPGRVLQMQQRTKE